MAPHNKKILFIVIDQLRADCLNGALAAHVNLPNLQALQGDAVSFSNHFTVTNPCGPARVSLLTGQYAMNHRAVFNGAPLAKGTPNLATEVRKAGYEPLLFGYTDTAGDPRFHHPNDPATGDDEALMEGFNERVEMRYKKSIPWRAYLKAKGYDIPAYEDFYNPVPENPGQPAQPQDPAFYTAEDSDTAFLTNSLLQELAVRTDESWFAHLTYIRPHPPLVAPVPYNRMYDPNKLPEPVKAGRQHPFTMSAGQMQPIANLVRGCDGIDESHTQTMRALYFGLATEVDHHIGRIIYFLKTSGQYDDTLIIVTADHGEMLGDHGLWAKQHIFDPAYHVSLIIRDPAHPEQHGTKITELTESIDVTPTLLDLVGLAKPKVMNGHSLRPFLAGETPSNWREYVHLELDFTEAGLDMLKLAGLRPDQANLAILRGKSMKLVHFASGFTPLLFDLENDPNEQSNLADDPKYAQAMLDMTRALLSHRMQNLDRSLIDLA
ncbi:MAG: arylsulfatase A-like enzyme [Paracoccaceae bacterium]|jgi:arylsulfatase A-like enzyme